MANRVRMACWWGSLLLFLCAGCERSETSTSLETPDEQPFVKPVGKSKAATSTCDEFLKRLYAACYEGGRKPVELNGAPLGGIVSAATIEQAFGKPDRVFHSERPDGKPTWHWYLKDGEVAIDVVKEFEESGDKLLEIDGIMHGPW